MEGLGRVWSWQIGGQGLTLGRMKAYLKSFFCRRKYHFSLFRQLAELTLDGKVLTSFSHRELKEPVSVAVSPTSGHWVVADIGARAVLVFEPSGKLVSFVYLVIHLQIISPFKVGHIGGQGELGELPSLAVGPDGEVLVADSKILVYSEEGVMVSKPS